LQNGLVSIIFDVRHYSSHQKRLTGFTSMNRTYFLKFSVFQEQRMITIDINKISVMLLLSFLLAFAVGIFRAPEADAGEKSIVIGLLPEMNVFKQKRRFEPLAAYLSKRMGIEVKLTILSRYGNIIERIKEEEIDGAFLGSFTGALAISQLGVVPLARPINMDGTSTYFGYIFTKKGSNIKTVADMQGKSLALVERATTAGYIFPLAWFKRHGVDDISIYFSDHFFTGSHDGAIDAVLHNKADVGAAKNTIYDRMRQSHPRIDEELVILAASPRVPSNGLCVRQNLASQYKEHLQNLLLSLHQDKEGIEVLKKLGAKRFVETSLEDYQPVLDLAVEAGIDLKRYDYYNP
jgi:phosphonate transport system substrate-binding protein